MRVEARGDMNKPLFAVAVSRRTAELRYAFTCPVISIHSPGGTLPRITAPAILGLCFHDLDLDALRREDESAADSVRESCFSDQQARHVLDFARDAEELVVHCDAGMSRSTAIVFALTEWRNGVGEKTGCPNFYVVSVMRRVIRESHKEP